MWLEVVPSDTIEFGDWIESGLGSYERPNILLRPTLSLTLDVYLELCCLLIYAEERVTSKANPA